MLNYRRLALNCKLLTIFMRNTKKTEVNQPQGLIGVLLDKNAEIGDRDDAAMDLSSYDAPEVEAALIEIASDATVDEMILESAGESLAEIWIRKKVEVSPSTLGKLRPSASSIVERYFELNAPG